MSSVSAVAEIACGWWLWRRDKDTYDRRFATFMWSIATMESLQGLLWFFALGDPLPPQQASISAQAHTTVSAQDTAGRFSREEFLRRQTLGTSRIRGSFTDVADAALLCNYLFSFLVVLSAWIQIPFAIVNFVPDDDHVVAVVDVQPPKNWRKNVFRLYFALQYLGVLFLQGHSGLWTTTAGGNGHQIWPCAAALGAAFPEGRNGAVRRELLPVAINGCVLGCLAYVSALGVAISPLPWRELLGFCVLGAVGFSYTFLGALGKSYEACSVWCWSAGSYGVFFVVRPMFGQRRRSRTTSSSSEMMTSDWQKLGAGEEAISADGRDLVVAS